MTDTPPLVSVIIPAYRRADFVNQAVASIGRQTFTDYEIIVVDDGSGDKLVGRYALPPEVTLIMRTDNSGRASIPRNEGARAARGRYLAFLDMDDIWLPEALATLVRLLNTHPQAALAFCHYTGVDESLQPVEQQVPPPVLQADALEQLLTRCIIRSTSIVLFRREAFEAAGGFDDAIIGTADWDLYLRLASSTPFAADPARLVQYRWHPGQQVCDKRRMHAGNVTVLEKAKGWLPAVRPDLRAHLRRQLARRYYAMARQQIIDGDDSHAVLQTCRAALRHHWCSFLAVRVLFRLMKRQVRAGRKPNAV